MTTREKKAEYNRRAREEASRYRNDMKARQEQALLAELERTTATAKSVRIIGTVAARYQVFEPVRSLGNEFMIY